MPEEPAEEKATQLPDELGGLSLISQKSGVDALRELSIMHQGSERLILIDGHIAAYGSEGREAIRLWVGEAEDEETAQRLLERMNAGMGSSGTFSEPQLHIISGKAVYFVTGMGMSNYYFASGRNVVWVATKNPDPSYGDALVLQLIEQG